MALEHLKAHWTEADESVLLDFLLTLDATAGDGKNFKPFVWTAASGKLNPLVTKGGPKLAKSCKNKWQSLKKTNAVVKAIQAVSGWTWDDVAGASIDESTADSWEAYVAKHKDAKPFRNVGWIHLHKVSLLLPATTRGTNIFRPSDASTGPNSSSAMTPPDESVPNAPMAPWDIYEPDGTQETARFDNEDTERTPEPLAPSPSLKRRMPATPTPRSEKKLKVSGPVLLESLAHSVNSFSDVIRSTLAPPGPDTPRRRQEAVRQAQKLEKSWLTQRQLLSLIKLLQKDNQAVETYTVLEDDVRKDWICDALDIEQPIPWSDSD
ncbi:hypothetical protein BJY52DRAFT_1200712 [Lactarius psammicola]|nr:hypothetical protein BJY52DRAFT_1200712 [Lactarius psammicola]